MPSPIRPLFPPEMRCSSKSTGKPASWSACWSGKEAGYRWSSSSPGWRFDPPVQDALFHFAVPAGVTIVNGELPSGDTGVK